MAGEIPGTSSARFPPAPRMPSGPAMGRAPGGDQVRDIRGRFSGGFAINWIGLQAIVEDLVKYEKEGYPLEERAGALAEDIRRYAQSNAPWQDVTGDARAGLDAEVDKRPNGEVAIVLFHTVPYGVYLENANGGSKAIVIPTMEHFADELVMRMFGPGTER